jgi:Holliday junction DNA helicase RuvA
VYDFLSGTLAVRKPDHVVIDVGGAGYRVSIPFSTYKKLPRSGAVKVFTYLKVAEDDLRLFGFATEEERQVFLRLVESVPKLGPSKAIAILSSMEVGDLMRAVEEGDADAIRRVPGVGPKIANRLVVELKGRLPEALTSAGEGAVEASIVKDAVQALVSLGFDRTTAETTVRKARKGFDGEATVEDLLRKCLETF